MAGTDYVETESTAATTTTVTYSVTSTALVTTDDVRDIALSLSRTTEHLVRDRVKFRIGSTCTSRPATRRRWVRDPRDERAAFVAAGPE